MFRSLYMIKIGRFFDTMFFLNNKKYNLSCNGLRQEDPKICDLANYIWIITNV